MTTTVLTDERILGVWGSTAEPCVVTQGNECLIHKFARAIEQAVLHSEQVQAWRAMSDEYNELIRHIHSGGDALEFLSSRAAMEKQP